MATMDKKDAAAEAAKSGYKKTKLGWIPEEWKITKLSKVGSISSGSTPARSSHEKYYANGTIPWVKTGDLTRGEILETEEHITSLALKESSCRLYQSKTVLVAMYGGFKQIGRTGILTAEAAINQAISAIEVDSSILLPEFLLAWLNQNIDYWKNFAASSRKDPNITGKDVQDFPIALPHLSEQHAIVEIVGKVNAYITATQDLLTAKRTYKRGLMQQLLTGQRRFPEFQGQPWREVKLGEVFSKKSMKNVGNRVSLVITVGKYAIRPQLSHFNRSVASSDLSAYNVIEPGDFVYDPMSAYYGAIGRYDLNEAGVVSPVYRVMTLEDGFDSAFAKQLLKSPYILGRLDNASTQGNKEGKRRGLQDGAFRAISFKCPSLPEQQRIAAVLTACDQEIELLQAQLRQWQQQKKGLMQQLLTGQLRVPT